MTTCSVPTQPRRASRRLRRVGRALIALAAAAAFIPAGGHPATAASTTASSVAAVFDGKALQGIPAKVRGGITELSLKNTGAFPVDLQFVRIQGARTDAAVAKALNADEAPPAWMEGFGGTNKAAAGTTARATVNLDKGTYLWVVLAGGSELDGKAPFGRFVVNGPKSSVPPSGSATVVALDYSFRATGLRTGINRVACRNDGKERHHVLMFRMKPGRTIDNVRKEVASDVQGPTQPVEEAGSQELPLISGGVTMSTDVTLSRGSYALVCFMPNAGGTPHAMLGMVTEVKITWPHPHARVRRQGLRSARAQMPWARLANDASSTMPR